MVPLVKSDYHRESKKTKLRTNIPLMKQKIKGLIKKKIWVKGFGFGKNRNQVNL